MRWSDDTRILLACITGGLVGGIGIATSWRSTTSKDFWDVMTAVGTVGAAVVAVGIALWQEHRARSEKMDKARLRASALTMRVAFVTAEISAGALHLTAAATHDCAPEYFGQLAARLAQVKVWDASEIEPLVSLPNGCAHNLAAAFDRLQVARSHLEAFALSQERLVSAERKKTAKFASILLTEAASMISAATTELQKASFAILVMTPPGGGAADVV